MSQIFDESAIGNGPAQCNDFFQDILSRRSAAIAQGIAQLDALLGRNGNVKRTSYGNDGRHRVDVFLSHGYRAEIALLDLVAPTPAELCVTGFLVMENS